MPTNEELVQKSITAADALASAGKLNDAQANKFIDYVFDLSVLKKVARIVRFRNENLDIDKIGVGSRVAMPASEARDPGRRRGVSHSKITLTPKELMVPFEISDTYREHNIEGDSAEDHIVRMMGTQAGNDIEELYIDGDTVGPAAIESTIVDDGSDTEYIKDSYLALFDGWMRQADSGNLVDHAGAAVSSSLFGKMINAMPVKFRRNRANLVFLCSMELEQLYRERVSTRATAKGDDALNSEVPLTPFGVPLVGVPLMNFYQKVVHNITFTGSGSTVSLRYAPIKANSLVVTPTTLGDVPDEAYLLTTDYTVDETAGTVTHAGGGSAIGTSATVKATFEAFPQLLLTPRSNLIAAIGRDIRIEKDRDIFKRVNQYALTTKVDTKFEEVTAVVKGYNISNVL